MAGWAAPLVGCLSSKGMSSNAPSPLSVESFQPLSGIQSEIQLHHSYLASWQGILLHVIDEQALEIYNSFQIDGDLTVTVLMNKFEEYFVPSTKITYARYKFSVCEKPGVGFDQYLAELHTVAKSCEFGKLKDQLIQDKIVTGIPDNGLREWLLHEKDLNLEKAVHICRVTETTRAQAKKLCKEETAVHTVETEGQRTG